MANVRESGTPEEPAVDKEKAKNSSGEPTLIQVAFPDAANTVFFTALAVGLGLIVLSTIFRHLIEADTSVENLILCVGVAIVLAAFGGQATVRVGRFVLAGAAALAVALFFVLPDNSAVGGSIASVDKSRFENISMKNHNPILGALVVDVRHPENSTFEFVMFESDLTESRIRVALDPKDETERPVELFVSRAKILSAFGSHQRLEWELKQDQQGTGEKIWRIRDLVTRKWISDDDDIASSDDHPITSAAAFISSARAQDAASAADLQTYFDNLTNDDASIRRGSRDALGEALTPDLVPVAMDNLRARSADYRVRLGIIVALTDMLRRDKSQNTAIAGKLTDADRNLLLDAAADPDRTLRVYATEFLFDLGDPRVTELALGRAAGAADQSAQYNWVFAAQDGWRKLSSEQRNNLQNAIGAIQGGAKTEALLSQFKQ
jgi:hypothetical protein